MDMESSSQYIKFDDSGEVQMKREYYSAVSSSSLSFISYIIQRPAVVEWRQFIPFLILRICFFLYALFFLVFGIVEFVARFTDYFWMLHLTMLTKLIVLRVALGLIKKRLEWQASLEFLRLMDKSIPFGKQYFIITSICNCMAMGFYYGVWADEFVTSLSNALLLAVFILGTLAYTLFVTCVLMVSITDAKIAYASVETLVASSKRGEITSDEYSHVYEEIRGNVKNGFYLNGTLMITMLSNTVAAIVLMLMFRKITDGEDEVHVVSFTVYVLVVQWATDVVFLYELLPEISSVNELAMHLHVVTACQRWVQGGNDVDVANLTNLENIAESIAGGSSNTRSSTGKNNNSKSGCLIQNVDSSGLALSVMEANRYDTLHRIIAQPIRYTIASIYFTKNGARNQMVGVVGAVLFSFVRVIVSLMLD